MEGEAVQRVLEIEAECSGISTSYNNTRYLRDWTKSVRQELDLGDHWDEVLTSTPVIPGYRALCIALELNDKECSRPPWAGAIRCSSADL